MADDLVTLWTAMTEINVSLVNNAIYFKSAIKPRPVPGLQPVTGFSWFYGVGSLVEKVSLPLINVLVRAKIHTRWITKGQINYSPYCFRFSCLLLKCVSVLLMFSNKLTSLLNLTNKCFRTNECSLKSLNVETYECFPSFKNYKVSKQSLNVGCKGIFHKFEQTNIARLRTSQNET